MDPRHRVVVLALDDVVAFDLGVPSQVLGAASGPDRRKLYRTRVATADGRPVRTSAGYSLLPEHGPEILDDAQTVIVPGVRLRDRFALSPTAQAAFARIPAGARLVSICTGAFALAATGRLDGRPATTHWAWAELFRSMFPSVRLDPDVLFVDDGDVLTSAGVAAGVDLCLHLVRRDFGADVANRAARRCVVPAWRDGGQAQFIERVMPVSPGASTSSTRQWALQRLEEPLDLSTMAAQASMSVRSFTRRFRDETGMSPSQWLTRQRVELARMLLETTNLSVDEVARRAGFGTAVSLRQHLHAAVGVSPLGYRRTFGSPAVDAPS